MRYVALKFDPLMLASRIDISDDGAGDEGHYLAENQMEHSGLKPLNMSNSKGWRPKLSLQPLPLKQGSFNWFLFRRVALFFILLRGFRWRGAGLATTI